MPLMLNMSKRFWTALMALILNQIWFVRYVSVVTQLRIMTSSFVVTTVRLLNITKNAVFHQSCKFLTVLDSVVHVPPTSPTLILVCWMQIMPLQPLLHPLPPRHPAPVLAPAPAPTLTPTPTPAQTLMMSLLLILLPVLMRLMPQTMNCNCQQEAKVGRCLVNFCWMRMQPELTGCQIPPLMAVGGGVRG